MVQEQIAEMQATWQDPASAWQDSSSAWDEPASGGGWDDPVVTTTSVQIESATVNNNDQQPVDSSVQLASGGGTSDGIVKCIAFYPYTVIFNKKYGRIELKYTWNFY